jgi:hypothetical protein
LELDELDVVMARSWLEQGLAMYRDVSNRRFVAASLEGLAAVCAAEGRPAQALRLGGAADALRTRIGRPLTDNEQARLERWLRPARVSLGDLLSASEYSSGQAMSLERAVSEGAISASR